MIRIGFLGIIIVELQSGHKQIYLVIIPTPPPPPPILALCLLGAGRMFVLPADQPRGAATHTEGGIIVPLLIPKSQVPAQQAASRYSPLQFRCNNGCLLNRKPYKPL